LNTEKVISKNSTEEINNSAERVLVTGADGMLGSSVCRELLKQNYQVRAFVISTKNNHLIEGLGIEIVVGNILDRSALETHMKGCSFVINIAALTNVWPRKSEPVMNVNLQGALNVAEIAESMKLKRMVQIGTASSFESGSKQNPGVETGKYDGDRFGMDYMKSKFLAQEALVQKHRESGFPVIIVNPTFMIGPFDSGPSSGKMILEFYKGKVPAYTAGGKNFVASRDVAVAAVNALKLGTLGECYIAGNENLSFGEFFKKIEHVTGKRFRMFQVPNFVLYLFGILNSTYARLTGKPPQISYTMARLAACGQYYSSKKAQAELNMPQTPIEDAIQQCLNWFFENGYLKKS
jgi:dihydroflavonol-4-reductase